MKKTFLFLIIIALVSVLGITLYLSHYYHSPVRLNGQKKVVRIQEGQGLNQIASVLHKHNIIDYPNIFIFLAQLTGKATIIKAGEFEINTGWSRKRILEHLEQGKVLLHELKIPEGLTWWETASIVEKSNLATFKGFKASVHNQTLLRQNQIPFETAEGFLFPETYFLEKDLQKPGQRIVQMMIKEFWKKTDSFLWPDKRPDQKRLRKIVILASLVEKETSLDQERKRIAGVFMNRLRKGMPLQCDPTVIYGLGQQYKGNLQKSHLRDRNNEYNTYVYRGLPPGPICSPGLGSLQAAKNPENNEYLYFVAQGNGSHKFSRTLREHNKAVRKYQLK